MKFVGLIFCFLNIITVSAQSVTDLQSRIDRLLNEEFYQGAAVGISVYDLTANKVLYQKNEKKLCRPASNMKLLTSAAALHYLTPAYMFATHLWYTGNIDDSGCLQGNIYMEGGFDPMLSSTDLDTMMSFLRKKGINSIRGTLFIDVSMADAVYWGKAWSWDDDLEAFQPYLSPLPINKGVVKLKVIPEQPGSAPLIKVDPVSSFIRVENDATTVWKNTEPTKKTLRFSRDCDGVCNTIVVSGTIAAASNSYETTISLQYPQGYISTLFMEKIFEQFPTSQLNYGGLSEVPAKAQNAGFVTHSLVEVMRQTNKESDNLNAEMFLYALGHQYRDRPSSTDKGIEMLQEMFSLAGLDPKKYSIVDGSGLSNQNYVSPELMVSVLKYMCTSADFDIFKNSLPVAGVDGTLAHRLQSPGTYRKVFAKTGSITGVSTLSGYLSTRDGHMLAFSIMIQNFVEKTSYVATHYVDKLCEALVK